MSELERVKGLLDEVSDLRAQVETAALTSSVLRAKLGESEQERDNLQGQLQAVEELNRHLLAGHNVTMMEAEIGGIEEKNAGLRSELQTAKNQISTWEEAYKLSVENGNKAWQTVADLQAAYGVIRGALEKLKDKFDYKIMHPDYTEYVSGEAFESGTLDVIDKALSTTPAEAGERVQGLVKAVENRVKSCRLKASFPQSRDDCLYISRFRSACPSLPVCDALAKFRGGKINE